MYIEYQKVHRKLPVGVHALPVAISVSLSFLFSLSRFLVHTLFAFGRSPSSSSLSSPCLRTIVVRLVSRWRRYPPYQPLGLRSSFEPSTTLVIRIIVRTPRLECINIHSGRNNLFFTNYIRGDNKNNTSWYLLIDKTVLIINNWYEIINKKYF